MDNEKSSFRVGINTFVLRDNKLLLGKRKGVGDGTWGLPGGHLEFKEDMEAAAARELVEETGLKVDKLEFINLVNNKERPDGKHYIQVGFLANDIQGEPVVKEPDKCSEWQWFSLSELPENIFHGHITQIQLFKNKVMFADS